MAADAWQRRIFDAKAAKNLRGDASSFFGAKSRDLREAVILYLIEQFYDYMPIDSLFSYRLMTKIMRPCTITA